jgi:hypothetical protein
MGFLKKFFRNVFHDDTLSHSSSSFEKLSEDELETHLSIARYGNFELSDAVRPSYDLEIVPRAGFRHDSYRDEESNTIVPVLMGAVTRQHVMEIFIELIEPLGNVVDVVLETSHGRGPDHSDLYREHLDMPILQSILWDFEDLLVNDGCAGIAVLNPAIPQEVQLDEHKLLIAYGKDLTAYENVLVNCNISCHEEIKFVTEAEHVHSTTDQYIEQFEQLKLQLGMDGYR